jgi:hypothetical protein
MLLANVLQEALASKEEKMLTLNELNSHANPSNWVVSERYTFEEEIEGEPVFTEMIRAHNLPLNKIVDIPVSEFNAFFINTANLTDQAIVKFSIDGTITTVTVGNTVVYED